MVYERCKNNEWLTCFIVAKHLIALTEVTALQTFLFNTLCTQYIKTSLPHHIEEDKCLCFTFQDSDGNIELVLNEKQSILTMDGVSFLM